MLSERNSGVQLSTPAAIRDAPLRGEPRKRDGSEEFELDDTGGK